LSERGNSSCLAIFATPYYDLDLDESKIMYLHSLLAIPNARRATETILIRHNNRTEYGVTNTKSLTIKRTRPRNAEKQNRTQVYPLRSFRDECPMASPFRAEKLMDERLRQLD
jgi:hypothetical protein